MDTQQPVDPQLAALQGSVVVVRVGKVAPRSWSGRSFDSAAVKTPQADAVAIGTLGLAGDEQAEKIHGGPEKAVLMYAQHHYPAWQSEGYDLPEGALFENITMTGLDETLIHLGDTVRVGTALLQATQPRRPCYKIAARWGIKNLPRLVQGKGRTGIYFRVLEPGEVRAGDRIQVLERLENSVPAAEVNRIMNVDRDDVAGIQALLASPELPPRWRQQLERRLEGHFESDAARLGEDD
ncbi:MOSC domain-containing protein [Gulosibacter bifidus]|uniref:MOSC domain-containing protein n=1 Tax=Gulosibacter bifidus TaxID=272239 RepID=A0ABW5RHF7_9MICO|nr:MOSC domain-containing protein [Gulosibacter bifidus]